VLNLGGWPAQHAGPSWQAQMYLRRWEESSEPAALPLLFFFCSPTRVWMSLCALDSQ
jgi:hypothetical protein